jgi:Holliday junction resolvase RusA-like endonuclease
MMLKILIPNLELPPSMWNLYKHRKSGRAQASMAYKNWKTIAAPKFNSLTPIRYMENVCISIRIWSKPTTTEDLDIDNRVKALIDQLVRSHYLKDDNCNIVRKINISYEGIADKNKCEIYIREMRLDKVKTKRPSNDIQLRENKNAKKSKQSEQSESDKDSGSENWDGTDICGTDHDKHTPECDIVGEGYRSGDDQSSDE